MPRWTPDPTFYPSPRLAAKAPAETLAYVAAFAPNRDVPDSIAVVDVDPASPTYSKIVGNVAAWKHTLADAGIESGLERVLLVGLCPRVTGSACRAVRSGGPGPGACRGSATSSAPRARPGARAELLKSQPGRMERPQDRRPQGRGYRARGPGGINIVALGKNKDGKRGAGVFVMDHESSSGLWADGKLDVGRRSLATTLAENGRRHAW